MRLIFYCIFLLTLTNSYGQWNLNGDNSASGGLTLGGMLNLDVYNSAQIRLNSSGPNYGKIGSTVSQVWSLGWGAGGSDINAVLNWTSTGNVGIQTTTPQGNFQVNQVHPIIMKNNGGAAIWGSEIGFNSVLNITSPAVQFKKLGGTSQQGGANIVVDYYGNMRFQTYVGPNENEILVPYNPQVSFLNNGNVGIGTTTPDAKLTVKGVIHTQELNIDVNGAMVPDYVFENNYDLKSIDQIEDFIADNKHLPEIPSAKEMEEKGMDVKTLNLLLLKKVEELTLYMIELKKENEKQNQQIQQLINKKFIK
jgi:hypothetical protein